MASPADLYLIVPRWVADQLDALRDDALSREQRALKRVLQESYDSGIASDRIRYCRERKVA